MNFSLFSKSIHYCLFLLILVIGGFLRFYNLNWDEGYLCHPDERNIALSVSNLEFPRKLDPGFYAYNGFLIYLNKGVGSLISFSEKNETFSSLFASLIGSKQPSFKEKKSSWTKDWAKINLVGRFLSATFSTASIYLIYLLGKSLIGKWGGLLSAAFFSFSPTFIQQAHFGVTESILVFFLLLIAILTKKILDKPKFSLWLALAFVCGLALGTKIQALSFLIIPFVAWLILFLKEKKLKLILFGISFLLFTFLFFFLVSPYTLLNFPKFKESMNYEKGVVSGTLKVPYNWQFSDTLPYLFFFKNLNWQIGPLLPTLGFLGIFLWLALILFGKEKKDALPFLTFGIFYFGYVGSWYTKFIRYMLPFIPVLIVGAVWLLLALIKYQKTKFLGKTLIGIGLLISVLWSLAFFSIYKNPHTRILASRWIYENVSPKSVLLVEHWDDRLPLPLEPSFSEYIFLEMKNYEPDTPQKISEMAENLERGDFLILASRRLSGSIGKNHEKWPITSKYYQKLFQGKLGYKLVYTASFYPKILNFEIKDDSAEETFQVYDHPTVYIFKNTERLSKEKIQEILFE